MHAPSADFLCFSYFERILTMQEKGLFHQVPQCLSMLQRTQLISTTISHGYVRESPNGVFSNSERRMALSISARSSKPYRCGILQYHLRKLSYSASWYCGLSNKRHTDPVISKLQHARGPGRDSSKSRSHTHIGDYATLLASVFLKRSLPCAGSWGYRIWCAISPTCIFPDSVDFVRTNVWLPSTVKNTFKASIK